MPVFFSVQVLSSPVAAAIEYFGDPETVETQKFVRTFDRFFDCSNTRPPKEGILKRKPDLSPYRSLSDRHLKVDLRQLALFINN